MKKVSLITRLSLVCLIVIAVSCSKESDLHQAVNDTTHSTEAKRIDNSFVVGQMDPQGLPVITFSIDELEILAGCVHLQSGEGALSHSRIERIGANFYLRGNVADSYESADFGYLLTVDGNELVYEEGNAINSCVSKQGETSCNLVILASGSTHCNQVGAECEQAVGPSYQCDWPWMIN